MSLQHQSFPIPKYQACNPEINSGIIKQSYEYFKPEMKRINCNDQYDFIISENKIIPGTKNPFKGILKYEIIEVPTSRRFEATKINQKPLNNNKFNYNSYNYEDPDLKKFCDNVAVSIIGRDTVAELLDDFRDELDMIERNFIKRLSKNSNGQLDSQVNPRINFTETGITYTEDVIEWIKRN
ncbi:hypothetical protein DMUE_2135 [Dictyocoela muelleri]|nr:hypothetical protein DMUE_2135 [Dictyocoela muelleri]